VCHWHPHFHAHAIALHRALIELEDVSAAVIIMSGSICKRRTETTSSRIADAVCPLDAACLNLRCWSGQQRQSEGPMSSRPVSGFTILSVRFRVGCPAAWGRYAKLFIATPMQSTQLDIPEARNPYFHRLSCCQALHSFAPGEQRKVPRSQRRRSATSAWTSGHLPGAPVHPGSTSRLSKEAYTSNPSSTWTTGL
jgi:hypothetical protein